MKTSLQPKNIFLSDSCFRDAQRLIPSASTGWFLLISPKGMNDLMLSAISRLGMSGSVRVLDGGNRFGAYEVARQVQGRSELLVRITVSRAFTCYQVLSLLESTPADSVPFVVLDMLRTFYDEAVPAGERKRLLQDCIVQLDRLGKAAAGLVSVYAPPILSNTILWMRGLLQLSARESLVLQPSQVAPERQLSFPVD